MEKKTLIFTATYNEAENIKDFLKIIDNLNLKADILIIDDNSPDGTSGIIEDYKTNIKNLNLITRSGKLGLDTAHKAAYDFGIQNNYEYLITLDADLTHDPKKIPEFISELNNDNVFVIGSRYMKEGKTDMKGLRFLLSFFGNKFIKFILNINCSEFTSSFRAFNLKKLGSFHLKIVSSKGQLEKAKKLCKKYKYTLLDKTEKSFVFEVSALKKEVDDLIKKLQPLGLASASRTGVVAMTRGAEIFK